MQLVNFVDGEFQQAHSTLPVIEPATGSLYAMVQDSSVHDIERAVRAANLAFPAWSTLAAPERAAWLRKIADGIEQRLESFALAESMDTGKPLHFARTLDIPRAIANFRYFASACETFHSESFYTPSLLSYTLRQPLGAVACISPWNLPLYLLSWKIAPALAFGNTVVAKPSEVTPLSAFRLAELCADLNFPAGVLNIVHGLGAGAGQQLVQHRGIRAVSFTGSTLAGRKIAEVSAAQFKKLSLELGGKNATVVFDDCNFAHAVSESVRAAFSNQGQICLCGSRVLVQRSMIARFTEAFVARARELVPADPALDSTRFAALVSSVHLRKVEDAVALAHEEGGRLLTGGERVRLEGRCLDGYFYPPTVFDQLSNDCQTNQNEIFGPVCTLIPFDDEAHAVQLANQCDYGLSASVFSQDIDRAQRVAGALQAGLVWINTWMQRDLRVPFGGVKQSGLGREGGEDALRFFTEAKSVGIALRASQ